jgi:hypothetical protein
MQHGIQLPTRSAALRLTVLAVSPARYAAIADDWCVGAQSGADGIVGLPLISDEPLTLNRTVCHTSGPHATRRRFKPMS